MGNFGDRRSGGRSFGKRSFGGDRGSRGPATLYPAVCSQCGRDCQVPFQPTGNKPVYCSDCFEKQGGSDSRGGQDRGSFGRPSHRFDDKPMFDAVCDSCGTNCKIPFQPRNGKPVYCSNCFSDQRSGDVRRAPERGRSEPQNSEQLDAINRKLDKILKLLTPTPPKKKTPTIDEVPATIIPDEIVVTDIVGEPVKE